MTWPLKKIAENRLSFIRIKETNHVSSNPCHLPPSPLSTSGGEGRGGVSLPYFLPPRLWGGGPGWGIPYPLSPMSYQLKPPLRFARPGCGHARPQAHALSLPASGSRANLRSPFSPSPPLVGRSGWYIPCRLPLFPPLVGRSGWCIPCRLPLFPPLVGRSGGKEKQKKLCVLCVFA